MSLLQKIKRRVLWQLFSRLPKNQNEVVLQSFYGRGYSDSPAAIAEELRRRGGLRLYWVVAGEKEAATLPPEVIPLRLDSVQAIFRACRAGFWVDSCRKWGFTRKGKNQFYIQTWHGFPVKRIEKDAGDALPPDYIAAAQHDAAMCDLMLSNSSFLTEIYKTGFWYDGAVLEGGFPRNDRLVGGDAAAAAAAGQALGVDADVHCLLYAPTFRKGMPLDVYDIDYAALVQALEQRFGGRWKILAKLHPNMAARAAELHLPPQYVADASAYPDITDLYLRCDAMVTDYSSVMFDFMVTGKPCFLYVNDLEAYKNDRNFYYDIDVLPFVRCETNAALQQAVLDFDPAAQQARVDVFRADFGIVESGRAAAQAVDQIMERRNKR